MRRATRSAGGSASSPASAARRASRRSLTVRENLFINPVTAGSEAAAADASRRRAGATRCACCTASRCGRRSPSGSSRRSRAATSRRSSWRAGWRPAATSWCSRSRPSASMSAPRRRSTSILQKALDEGLAVLLISSDFEEVAGICHRALIFDRGSVTAELTRSRADDRAADRARFGRRREEDRSEAWHERSLRQQRPHVQERAPRISSRCGTWRSSSSC